MVHDPSVNPADVGDMGGIDCTKPWGEPYEERVAVDQEVLERIRLADLVSPEALTRINAERM